MLAEGGRGEGVLGREGVPRLKRCRRPCSDQKAAPIHGRRKGAGLLP